MTAALVPLISKSMSLLVVVVQVILLVMIILINNTNNTIGNENEDIDSSISALLDPEVNSKLRCEHGNLQLHFRRSSQEISSNAWAAIQELFPKV